jgi:hypothetical protein
MSILGIPALEPVSTVTSAKGYALGTRRQDSAGNEYVYGYNASNVPLYPGVPVVIGSNNTSYSFTLTNTASQTGWVAAVVHHATVPTAYYAWFGVKGLFRVVPDATQSQIAKDKNLAIAVDGGWNSAPATISTGIRWGFSIESIVTGYGSCASESTSGLGCLGRAWIKTVLG